LFKRGKISRKGFRCMIPRHLVDRTFDLVYTSSSQQTGSLISGRIGSLEAKEFQVVETYEELDDE